MSCPIIVTLFSQFSFLLNLLVGNIQIRYLGYTFWDISTFRIFYLKKLLLILYTFIFNLISTIVSNKRYNMTELKNVIYRI